MIHFPQQVLGGPKTLHGPLIKQLALLTFNAPSRSFTAALGTGETAALGAATATMLESARMNASEEIVSPRILSILLYMQWDQVAIKAGSGLAQGLMSISEDQDTYLYTQMETVNFRKNFELEDLSAES